MNKTKYLITWYELGTDDMYHQRTTIVRSKYRATQIYNGLAEQDSTLLIELEEL